MPGAAAPASSPAYVLGQPIDPDELTQHLQNAAARAGLPMGAPTLVPNPTPAPSQGAPSVLGDYTDLLAATSPLQRLLVSPNITGSSPDGNGKTLPFSYSCSYPKRARQALSSPVTTLAQPPRHPHNILNPHPLPLVKHPKLTPPSNPPTTSPRPRPRGCPQRRPPRRRPRNVQLGRTGRDRVRVRAQPPGAAGARRSRLGVRGGGAGDLLAQDLGAVGQGPDQGQGHDGDGAVSGSAGGAIRVEGMAW